MVTLDFHSTLRSGQDSIIRTYVNDDNELFILIRIDEHNYNYVCLDKETAIKFAKEVRKQISFLED